jgi:hypothetical protein
MATLAHWSKVVPATAGAFLVGWTTPAQAFFPSYLPDIVGRPVTTIPVPVPPPTNDPPTDIPVPPLPVPPTPVPPTPVPPTPVPPPDDNNPPTEVPPTCECTPNTPNSTPEPATLVSGLIGLGVAGAVRARRRFGADRK